MRTSWRSLLLAWFRWWKWKRPLVVAGMLCFISVGVVFAGNNLSNLGKPTNDVSPLSSFPLDGFRHDGHILRSSFRPELLFLGTLSLDDHGSQIERWPVVKALDQFGSFSGLKPWMPPCPRGRSGPAPAIYCPFASFDWSHATYRSRYVTFVHRDLVDEKHRLYQRLTPNELRLFHRYEAHGKSYRDSVLRSITFGSPTTARVLPLVDVGGYHQTLSQILIGNDLSYLPPGQGTTYNVPLSFGKIQTILQSGQDSGGSRTVENVNAEANIMTALICRTDGLQPHHVCRRPAIGQILKQVK